jgi:hypothetical protein
MLLTVLALPCATMLAVHGLHWLWQSLTAAELRQHYRTYNRPMRSR